MHIHYFMHYSQTLNIALILTIMRYFVGYVVKQVCLCWDTAVCVLFNIQRTADREREFVGGGRVAAWGVRLRRSL